jgi:DNA-binding transcriptional ArsR family regulator
MNRPEESKSEDTIEILSTDNEKIKLMGEILSNESSRGILELLFDNSMTSNQIAQKTDISLSVVIHHLKKMQELRIIKIDRIEKNSKEHDMKYYIASKFAVIILPSRVYEKAKSSKSLKNLLKRIYTFAAISIAALVPWLVMRTVYNINSNGPTSGVGTISQVKTIPDYVFWSTVISLVIIIAGLTIVLIQKHK